MDEYVAAQVATLVGEVVESAEGKVERITIDVQDSGEHPYRIQVAGETLPVVGVAFVPVVPGDTSNSSSGVAEPKLEATSNG